MQTPWEPVKFMGNLLSETEKQNCFLKVQVQTKSGSFTPFRVNSQVASAIMTREVMRPNHKLPYN